jgi:5-methylcytosine-specific restriction enzyme subunit McrC
VIDTKFTSVLKRGQFGQETLSSGYVYQMYAYLMSQDAGEVGTKSEGLMLHPAVGADIDEEIVIQGHRIRFATVDLTGTAHSIANGLLGAISAVDTSLVPHIEVTAHQYAFVDDAGASPSEGSSVTAAT